MDTRKATIFTETDALSIIVNISAFFCDPITPFSGLVPDP